MHGQKKVLMPRDYIYYIETDGSAEMNKMIGDALAERACVCECTDLAVKNGRVPAIECPDYEFLRRFEEAAKSLSGKYRIWVKEGKAETARHFSGNILPAVCSSGRKKRSKVDKNATFRKLKARFKKPHKGMRVSVSVKVS